MLVEILIHVSIFILFNWMPIIFQNKHIYLFIWKSFANVALLWL